jgi:hypothetical protein
LRRRTAAGSSDRQLNLGFGRNSKLQQDLRRASSITGEPRTKIARAVLEQFLPVWLAQRQRDRARVTRAVSRIGAERGVDR